MTTPKCVFRSCGADARYLAYSTVGCGHAHACERHAPAWLKAGAYPACYSPVPIPRNAALADQTAQRINAHLRARKD